MATLTAQKASLAGTTPSFASAAGGGDEFLNDGDTVIHVKNGSGGSINVTVNSQTPCSQGFDHDLVVAVGAGAEKIIGPFAKARFDDANGKVQLTYSGVTSLTLAVISHGG
jgi:hypothetical protein